MKRNIEKYCDYALNLSGNIGMTFDELFEIINTHMTDKQTFVFGNVLDIACTAFNFGFAVGYKHALKHQAN